MVFIKSNIGLKQKIIRNWSESIPQTTEVVEFAIKFNRIKNIRSYSSLHTNKKCLTNLA